MSTSHSIQADVEHSDTETTIFQGEERRLMDGDSFLARLLIEQHELTAVEQFSQQHSAGTLPSQAKYYEKLLPAAPPGEGEQYAFEVNLDACSGCKACVVACHSLNGLDERETWRDVGLLTGGTSTSPVMQHVTTACHHCLEPGCMIACPVDAYEKDPSTGIVRHLDDQCFGCQYCTLACPYDVPKYHSGKGIVRKCDMCADRLAEGEAPACVQSCPHEAISIKVVSTSQVRENAELDTFLPASPEPHLTYPTTTYKTNRVFPRNTLPADYYSINPQHPHWPLIIMLVLTQLSIGTFAVGQLLSEFLASEMLVTFRPIQAMLGLGLAFVALGASTLHLGRPQYAFRAIVGLRHSWLSREIVAFGLFAGVASAYSAAIWFKLDDKIPVDLLGWGVVATGLLGLFCSAMIYVFTQREFWNLSRTLTRFLLTSAVLGIAITLVALLGTQWYDPSNGTRMLLQFTAPVLTYTLIGCASFKIAWEASLLFHLMDRRHCPMKRSAMLVAGPLRSHLITRLVLGGLGGILIPLFLLASPAIDFSGQLSAIAVVSVALLFTTSLGGELLERYLFFAAVSAARMPGGPRS